MVALRFRTMLMIGLVVSILGGNIWRGVQLEAVAVPSDSSGSPEGAANTQMVPVLQIQWGANCCGDNIEAQLSLNPSNGVHALNLLLQFEPDRVLSATASDFERNEAFFPSAPSIGGQQLNRVLDAGPGRIRIVSLAPAQTTGAVEIGRLHLHVSPNAPVGATQLITVTGEINDAIQGVTTIEPVVAVFQVRESDLSPTPTASTSPTPPGGTSTPTVTPTPPAVTFHHIYLPLLDRAYAR